jgi:hypothetical protein
LVCHHHPLPLSGWAGSDDTEFIRNGQILLDEISAVTSTSWLVIHGHRHLPQLIHGASNNNHIPFVFGAGSLGARVAGVPNQFHLLTLCTPPQSDHASISGVIETWLWTDANGWTAGTNNEALPGRCGFGYTGQIKYLADKISADCHSNGFNTWQEILSKFPSIGFLIPRAFEELETILQRLGINVLRDRHGKIVQVGK